MTLDIAYLQKWVGRETLEMDLATADPARRFAATFDHDERSPQEGEELPPLSHWLYFLPHYRQSGLNSDGHDKLGNFLPPIPLPRRMWAGSLLTFHSPLQVGEQMTRRTKIARLDLKEGRSGRLVFLSLEHEISTERGLLISEAQDLVYRDEPKQEPNPASSGQKESTKSLETAPAVQWSREIDPHPTLLFRFSALTFNAHRIHYDLTYAREVEGYPDLVVHGPLTATLLVDLLRRQAPEKRIRTFSFRALKPLFAGSKFLVCAGPWKDKGGIDLWAQNAAGERTSAAQASVDATGWSRASDPTRIE
ncbi:MAG: MaoC family dehydratase N-terminal domain-containing protein [Beijerinckiaceae bacterium]